MIGVKHLNPRQGIKTGTSLKTFLQRLIPSVKHLNPRQGIKTIDEIEQVLKAIVNDRVKHLNPRQGIKTDVPRPNDFVSTNNGVKHLNPRQGIKTRSYPRDRPASSLSSV